MSATTLDGKLANKGLLGPKVAIGDRLDAIHDALTTTASALDTALTAVNVANLNQCFNAAGLAEGTAAGTFQIANAITYTIGGTRYTKGATDDIAFTAAAVQATDTNCIYLVCINAAGTLSTVKGTAVAAASAASCPAPASASVCPIGWIHVATASAATFTAGTTDLGAANVTDTFVDFVGANPAQGVAITTALSTLNAALVAAQPAAI